MHRMCCRAAARRPQAATALLVSPEDACIVRTASCSRRVAGMAPIDRALAADLTNLRVRKSITDERDQLRGQADETRMNASAGLR